MYGLKLAGVDMNRKMLAEMAVNDADGFKTHHPLRFVFENETAAVSCTWPVANNVLRLVIGFASIIAVVVCCIFAFPMRGPLMYLFGIITILLGVGFGYVGYSDSSALSGSKKWCSDGMGGVPWTKKPTNPSCEYTPLIFTCVVDFLSAALCILFAVFAVCFVCRADPVSRNKRKKDSLLSEDNSRDEEEPTPDPFEKLSRQGKKDPRDQFGETEEEKPAKSKSKSRGFFGRGKKKAPTPDNSSVNFEQESASRFAPMSKTDKEASDKPLGTVDSSSSSGKNVGNALFNFDDMPSTDEQQKPAPKPQQLETEQPMPEPKPQQQQPKPQPKPQQQGGVVDFDSLSGGADSNPFA